MTAENIARRGGFRQGQVEQQKGSGAERGEDKGLLGNQCNDGDQGNAQPTVDQVEQRQHQAGIKPLAHHIQMQLPQQAADQLLAQPVILFTHLAHYSGANKERAW